MQEKNRLRKSLHFMPRPNCQYVFLSSSLLTWAYPLLCSFLCPVVIQGPLLHWRAMIMYQNAKHRPNSLLSSTHRLVPFSTSPLLFTSLFDNISVFSLSDISLEHRISIFLLCFTSLHSTPSSSAVHLTV